MDHNAAIIETRGQCEAFTYHIHECRAEVKIAPKRQRAIWAAPEAKPPPAIRGTCSPARRRRRITRYLDTDNSKRERNAFMGCRFGSYTFIWSAWRYYCQSAECQPTR